MRAITDWVDGESMQEHQAFVAPSTPVENAAMVRAVADIEAGRLNAHDEVFARLDAKHGW